MIPIIIEPHSRGVPEAILSRPAQVYPSADPGSKMTISGHPEIGLEDVPWMLAAHRFDVLRTSIDPKMVQILTKIFKTILKKLIFIKVQVPLAHAFKSML